MIPDSKLIPGVSDLSGSHCDDGAMNRTPPMAQIVCLPWHLPWGPLWASAAIALSLCAALAWPVSARADDDTGYRDNGYHTGAPRHDDREEDDHTRHGDDLSDHTPSRRPPGHNTGHHDHDEARRLLQAGRIRSLMEIMSIVEPHLEGRVIATDFELNDGVYVYEFKVVTPTGRMREVYVNAATAAVVKIEDD